MGLNSFGKKKKTLEQNAACFHQSAHAFLQQDLAKGKKFAKYFNRVKEFLNCEVSVSLKTGIRESNFSQKASILVRNEAFQQGLFKLMRSPEKLSFEDRKDLITMFQDTLRAEEGMENGYSEFLLKEGKEGRGRAEELLDVFMKQ